MSITSGPEYFSVHLNTPTLRMIKWRNANPAKIPGTPARNKRYWAKQKAAAAEARAAYDKEFAILKEAGLHRSRRFQYEETANRYIAEIERDYGVKLEVSKAFDLYF